jgi:hypothetical protein
MTQIDRVPCISTAHLTEKLGTGFITEHDLLAADSLGYGYYLYSCKDTFEQLRGQGIQDIHDLCMWVILHWAVANDFDFIRFDQDGDLVPDLPTWEW